jgi:hypothetical protein
LSVGKISGRRAITLFQCHADNTSELSFESDQVSDAFIFVDFNKTKTKNKTSEKIYFFKFQINLAKKTFKIFHIHT